MTIPEWLYAMLASINVHFITIVQQGQDLKTHVLTEKRETNLDNWCEVLVQGPHFNPRDVTNFDAEVTILTMVNTVRKDNKMYKHYDNIKKAMEAYDFTIPITEEDGTIIDCFQLDVTEDTPILVMHYGEVDIATSLFRSSIEATYKYTGVYNG